MNEEFIVAKTKGELSMPARDFHKILQDNTGIVFNTTDLSRIFEATKVQLNNLGIETKTFTLRAASAEGSGEVKWQLGTSKFSLPFDVYVNVPSALPENTTTLEEYIQLHPRTNIKFQIVDMSFKEANFETRVTKFVNDAQGRSHLEILLTAPDESGFIGYLSFDLSKAGAN